MRFLFLLFVILPVVEITLLIKVGGWLGVGPTVALILTSAVLGAYLLRRQGLSTLMRINQRLAVGEVPAREMLEGVVLAVGGALLLTPGFVTDIMGLCCVLPGTRQLLVRGLVKRALIFPTGRPRDPFGAGGPMGGDAGSPEQDRRPKTIEGEFRRED